MRLVAESDSQGLLDLPIGYNHLVQAAIYSNISTELANFLHDKGLFFGKRAFKFFTFSRLQGNYGIRHERISFRGRVALCVSSPVLRFVKELANAVLKKGFIMLGDSRLKIVELSFPPEPKIGNEVRVRMLSPVTMYSTLLTADKRKKTYYYSPYEREFSPLLDGNAKKKCFILYGRKIESELTVKPLNVREVLVTYKGTVVKGWMGSFTLKGPRTLIRTAYEAGLGSKNSQGFGMFEVVE
jgi:CRISPR-associated endoribonuclease Cas6